MQIATCRSGVTAVSVAAMILSATAQSQESSTRGEAALCASMTTHYYLFPSGPRIYECCTLLSIEPPVLTGVVGPRATPKSRSVATPNPSSERIVASSPAGTCVDLASLTPAERVMRLLTVDTESCIQFISYDHFPCSCSTNCSTCVLWSCNCPNLAPNTLPEIKPQDSLGSQVEKIGSSCTPCNEKSTSCENGP